MGIVIDTCAISRVFNENNTNHSEFKPIYKWLTDKKGKLVIGGVRYLEELPKMPTYLALINELSRASKINIVKLNDDDVNKYEEQIKPKTVTSPFNDHHIIAIVVISGVGIICSSDTSAYPFFKDKTLYPKNVKPPKIYSFKNHKKVLLSR